MGFGSETVITVGSSAYNLAGEPKDRGNFLKNNIIGSVMSGSSAQGLGNSIFTAHRFGPRTDLINFGRWAETSGFNTAVGFPKGFTYMGARVDVTAFNMLKSPEPSKESKFLYGRVDSINYEYLARWYIGEYLPERASESFTVAPETVTSGPAWDPETTTTGRLLLSFVGSSSPIAFTPPVVINDATNGYAYFFYRTRNIEPPSTFNTGWVNVVNEAAFPSVVGYTFDAAASTSQNVSFSLLTRTKTTIEYSDSTPTEETTNTTSTTTVLNEYTRVYKKQEIFPAASGIVGSYTRDWVNRHRRDWTKITLPPTSSSTTEEISPGVFKTTTVEITEDTVVVSYDYQNTWSQTLTDNWGNERVLVYKQGTNSAADNYIFGDYERVTSRYLPIIPLRLRNQAVNKTIHPAQYNLNRKAARKAFKKANTIDKLLKNLEDNDQIKEIDHAWVVFGCSLGSKEQDALNYNFQFMKDWVEGSSFIPGQIKNPIEYASAVEDYWDAVIAYENFVFDPSIGVGGGVRPPYPNPPDIAKYVFQTYQVRNSYSTDIPISTPWAYNVKITASGGHLRTGTGLHSRAEGKSGNCWVYQDGVLQVKNRRVEQVGDSASHLEYFYDSTPIIVFGKQLTNSSWEEYVFFDVAHTNYVYNGLDVTTLAHKALTGGENSSFIFPISDQVLKNMQLIEGTQLALSSSYLVINYYDKQKIPWYATGFFKVVLVVVAVVVAVYTGYVSGETLGVLGSNAAVGAAIGFAAGSTAAIIAGAVVNALAAAIVSAIISKLSTALLGDKIGAVVGAVLSMVVVWGMSNNWNFNTTDLVHSFTRADNLLKLTLSGADMAAQYMQSTTQQIIADTQSLMEDYKDKATELAAMTQQYLGSSGIAPAVIAEATRNLVESPEDFMNRTLMTGDDIADISLSLVERFPEPQMKLPYT